MIARRIIPAALLGLAGAIAACSLLPEPYLFMAQLIGVAGLLLTALLMVAWGVLAGIRAVLRGIRRAWAFRERTTWQVAEILEAHEAPFAHIDDGYLQRLADFYLLPGEDFS